MPLPFTRSSSLARSQTLANSARWSCAQTRGVLIDVLDLHCPAARSWDFVSPDRIVVRALTGSIHYAYGSAAGELVRGESLTLAPLSAALRLSVSAGSELRVAFERALGPDDRVNAAPLPSPSAPATGLRSAPLRGPVARAVAYIARNVEEDFDLAALAAAVGVAPCHLCRAFRAAMGLPPYRFRTHLRVARARERLASGMDCMEVAHAVGFCDQSHLTRIFKELTGTTPGAYAKASRALAISARRATAA